MSGNVTISSIDIRTELLELRSTYDTYNEFNAFLFDGNTQKIRQHFKAHVEFMKADVEYKTAVRGSDIIHSTTGNSCVTDNNNGKNIRKHFQQLT